MARKSGIAWTAYLTLLECVSQQEGSTSLDAQRMAIVVYLLVLAHYSRLAAIDWSLVLVITMTRPRFGQVHWGK